MPAESSTCANCTSGGIWSANPIHAPRSTDGRNDGERSFQAAASSRRPQLSVQHASSQRRSPSMCRDGLDGSSRCTRQPTPVGNTRRRSTGSPRTCSTRSSGSPARSSARRPSPPCTSSARRAMPAFTRSSVTSAATHRTWLPSTPIASFEIVNSLTVSRTLSVLLKSHLRNRSARTCLRPDFVTQFTRVNRALPLRRQKSAPPRAVSV